MYNVIGAGLTGAVIARELYDAGHDVQIFEKSDHVGGMCYDKEMDGIMVCQHGGHIFHTCGKFIWDWVNRFTNMIPYTHRVLACYNDTVFSFPVNLTTLYQLYGVSTYIDLMTYLKRDIVPCDNPRTVEQYALSVVGKRVYHMLIEGYTYKQWGVPASQLPASIIKRIPLRMDVDDRFFNDKYEGIPDRGYTKMIENIIGPIPVHFNRTITRQSRLSNVICTASLDEYFGYTFGILPYRSLRHEHDRLDCTVFGVASVNFTSTDVPYTRIVEHKFFRPDKPVDHSIITTEYPVEFDGTNDRYYPIPLEDNMRLHKRYIEFMLMHDAYPAGRLGNYQYYNMDDAVKFGIDCAHKIIK